MKTILKVFWPVIALLALNACKNDNEDLVVNPPVGPAEVNKMVFVGDNIGMLVGVDALSGQRQWSYTTLGIGSFSSPAATDKFVVFADALTQTISCLDVATGAQLWEKADMQLSPLCSPVIMGGELYINDEYKMQVLNLATGAVEREFTLTEYPNIISRSGNLIIYNTCGGYLAAVDKNGNVVWQYQSTGGCYHTAPAIANGQLYILSSEGKLSVLDAVTGLEKWTANLQAYVNNSSLVYFNNMLFALDGITNDKLYAFNATDGSLLHTYLLPNGESCNFLLAPAVMENRLYFLTEEGTLTCYDVVSGNLLWMNAFSIDAVVKHIPVGRHNRTEAHSDMTSVVYVNGLLYFGAGKSLYAVDVGGRIRWQNAMPGFLYAPPVILTNFGKAYRAATAGAEN